MRYVLDLFTTEGQLCELSFRKDQAGEFNMEVRNIESNEWIEVSLNVDALKQLNALSFKCRKEAEKDLKKYREEVNNG